jgi:hypothetical protein
LQGFGLNRAAQDRYSAARVEREDRLVDATLSPLMLGDQSRLELAAAVTRDLDFDFRAVGLDSLSAIKRKTLRL